MAGLCDPNSGTVPVSKARYLLIKYLATNTFVYYNRHSTWHLANITLPRLEPLVLTKVG